MTEEQKFKIKGLSYLALAIIVIVTLLLQVPSNPDTIGTEHVAVAPKIWKDKDSATHVVTTPITASNPKEFLKIQAQDKIIQDLQVQVAKYKRDLGKKGSVTVVQGTNSIDTVYLPAPVVPKGNLVWSDSIHNKWIIWDYKVEKDTLAKLRAYFKLKTTDDLVIINRLQSNGWFKAKSVVTEVVNKNPYSNTVNSATFNIDTKIPRRPWSIGPYVGYGFGDDITPQVNFGVSLQYGIIRF